MAETTPLAIALPDRALVAVSGRDAASFLNGLVTADIEKLQPGKAAHAALLTPQGKIIAEFLVLDACEAGGAPEEALYLIDIRRGYEDQLVEKLGFYKLRAAVEIARVTADVQVMAVFGQETAPGAAFYAFADPRHAGLGTRLYGPADALAAAVAGLPQGEPAEYHARRVAIGVPELGPDFIAVDAFPHDVLLDFTGGVDFRKGCFIGQEVVSRMEHRGTARKRAVRLAFEGGFGALGGSEIRAGERVLGASGEAFDGRAIGIVRLDRLEEALAAGETISAGGVPVMIDAPDFAWFTVPQPAG